MTCPLTACKPLTRELPHCLLQKCPSASALALPRRARAMPQGPPFLGVQVLGYESGSQASRLLPVAAMVVMVVMAVAVVAGAAAATVTLKVH